MFGTVQPIHTLSHYKEHNMKTLTLVAAFFALTVAGFAQNGATQLADVRLYGEFYNDCCEEVVNLKGRGHAVLRNNDGVHLDMTGATCTGESGRVYSQQGAITQNLSVKENGSYILTFQMKMVSDDGCSFTIRIQEKMMINANGEVTVEVLNYKITCE